MFHYVTKEEEEELLKERQLIYIYYDIQLIHLVYQQSKNWRVCFIFLVLANMEKFSLWAVMEFIELYYWGCNISVPIDTFLSLL